MISKDLPLEGEGGILQKMLRLGYFEPTHRTSYDYFYSDQPLPIQYS